MNFPFTIEQFMKVFEDYNLGIWPIQIFGYILGLLALVFIFKKFPYSNRITSAILGFFWIWMGAVYHIMYFSEINKAAKVFGLLFIIQGILFILFGVIKQKIVFDNELNRYTIIGSIFILYALFVYSLIGMLQGHNYPKMPIFSVAPCPTAIFTFGILLFAKKLPRYILIIPVLWSLIGFLAALKLGIKEDVGLLIAGVVSTVIIILKDITNNETKKSTDTII